MTAAHPTSASALRPGGVPPDRDTLILVRLVETRLPKVNARERSAPEAPRTPAARAVQHPPTAPPGPATGAAPSQEGIQRSPVGSAPRISPTSIAHSTTTARMWRSVTSVWLGSPPPDSRWIRKSYRKSPY